MYHFRYTICMVFVLLLCAAPLWCQEQKTPIYPQNDVMVSVEPFYVLGAAMPITLDLVIDGPYMLYEGFPTRFFMALQNIDTKELLNRLPVNASGGTGTAGPPDPKDFFPVDGSAMTRYTVDLMQLFAIKTAGQYRLNMMIHNYPITIVDGTPSQTLPFSGSCALPMTPRSHYENKSKVTGTVDVLTVTPGTDAKPVTVLRLSGVTIENGQLESALRLAKYAKTPDQGLLDALNAQKQANQQDVLRFRHYVLPEGGTVEQAVLDNKWQLWLLLAAPGQHSLVVWDLLRDTTHPVIPWGNDPIDFRVDRSHAVIARTGANPWIGTLSYRGE